MIETVYTLVGGVGKYQLMVAFCAFLAQVNNGLNVLCPIFINKKQDIICQLDDSLVNISKIPSTELSLRNGTSTNQYIVNQKQCTINYINSACKKLMDMPDPMTATVRTKYRMICENNYLSSVTVLMFMVGIFLGSVFGGIFNDKFGRKKGCIACYYMMAIFATAAAFAPEFWTFSLARFIVGFATSLSFISNSGMVLEIVDLKKRTSFGFLWNLGYDSGHVILVFLAYFIRDQFYLQITIFCISYITLLAPLFFKDSFRWLLMKERYAEAKTVILDISKINGINTEPETVDTFIDQYIQNKKSSVIGTARITDIIHYPVVMICMFCLWFLYFSSSFSYYTFVLGSASVSKNIYVATLISGVSAWVFRLLYMVLCFKVPRTIILMSLQFGLFLLFISSMLIKYFIGSNNIYTTILLMLAVAISVTNFGFMWIYGGETFPTVVRATSVSFGSAFARVAGMIASQIQWVFEVSPYALPSIGAVMGAMGTLFSIFILPETFQKQSLDFLAQAEKKFVHWRQSWRKRRMSVPDITIIDLKRLQKICDQAIADSEAIEQAKVK